VPYRLREDPCAGARPVGERDHRRGDGASLASRRGGRAGENPPSTSTLKAARRKAPPRRVQRPNANDHTPLTFRTLHVTRLPVISTCPLQFTPHIISCIYAPLDIPEPPFDFVAIPFYCLALALVSFSRDSIPAPRYCTRIPPHLTNIAYSNGFSQNVLGLFHVICVRK